MSYQNGVPPGWPPGYNPTGPDFSVPTGSAVGPTPAQYAPGNILQGQYNGQQAYASNPFAGSQGSPSGWPPGYNANAPAPASPYLDPYAHQRPQSMPAPVHAGNPFLSAQPQQGYSSSPDPSHSERHSAPVGSYSQPELPSYSQGGPAPVEASSYNPFKAAASASTSPPTGVTSPPAPSRAKTPPNARPEPVNPYSEDMKGWQRGQSLPAAVAAPSAPNRASVAIKQSTRPFEVISTPTQFILQRKVAGAEVLTIEKKNGHPGAFRIGTEKPKDKQISIYTAYGLIGIIAIQNESFLILITGIEPIGRIQGDEIFKITSTHFVSFSAKNEYLYSQQPKSPASPVQKFIQSEAGLMFFSFDYHLTHSLQRQQQMSAELESKPMWKAADRRFWWNRYLARHFTKNKLHDFITVIIRGHIGISMDQYLPETRRRLDYILISRLSCLRAGTRYNARGVNDEGNVGNFVETEQILDFDDYTASWLQIRGSVPIFWEEPTIKGSHVPTLTRTPEATVPAFRKHFETVLEKYKSVHIVNLLGEKVKEAMVTAAYEDQLVRFKGLNSRNIHYTHFDFHNICANRKYDNIRHLFVEKEVQEDFDMFQYFLYNKKTDYLERWQNGTFRTNCLDCLDRTNVTQTALAKKAMEMQIKDLAGQPFVSEMSRFMQIVNESWANNGDSLSRAYTGTGAMKSSYTRKGKHTFAGLIDDGIKSLTRVYVNTFKDEDNQEAIDMFLGKIEDLNDDTDQSPEDVWVRSQIVQRQLEFSTLQAQNILVGSFNCNAQTPRDNMDISDWLTPIKVEHDTIDMYIFGFQEIVELNATQIWNSDTQNCRAWEMAIQNRLNTMRKGKRVVLLRSSQLVGIFICIFVVEDQIAQYRGVDAQTVSVGLQGLTGNKGAAAIRFQYKDSSFCFVCAHLSAGQKIDPRLSDYNSISHQLRFGVNRNYALGIADHDLVFWLGDFNFRIGLTYDEVVRRTYEQDWEYLLRFDQLKNAQREGLAFRGYDEAPIGFAPTYKYNRGTDIYDTSEKQRVPAWTDRVVWRRTPDINPLFYGRNELLFSDHRPVKACFEVAVRTIERDKLKKLESELYRQAKEMSQDQLIKLGAEANAQNASRNSSPGQSPAFRPASAPYPASPAIQQQYSTPVQQQPAPAPSLPPRPASSEFLIDLGDDEPIVVQGMQQMQLNSAPPAPARASTDANLMGFESAVSPFKQYHDAIQSICREYGQALGNTTFIMSTTNLLASAVKHLLDLLDDYTSHQATPQFQSELLGSMQAVATSARLLTASPTSDLLFQDLLEKAKGLYGVVAKYYTLY